jgi:hypothetical protein
MMYLTIGFGWVIAAGLVLAASRMAAVGDSDRSSAPGCAEAPRMPLSDSEE